MLKRYEAQNVSFSKENLTDETSYVLGTIGM